MGPECDSCGASNPPGSHFCQSCGLPLTGGSSRWLGGTRYTGLRWQIDPMDPPPRRDSRWVSIVLGASLLVMGALLLVISGIVGAALSAGGADCAGSRCPIGSPAVWLATASVPCIAGGAVLLGVGLWRALR